MCKLIGVIVLLSASSLLYASGVSSEVFLLAQDDNPAIALNNYLTLKNFDGDNPYIDHQIVANLVDSSKFRSVTNVGFKNLALQFKILNDRQFYGEKSVESLGRIIQVVNKEDKRSVYRLTELVENDIKRSYVSLGSKFTQQMASEFESKHKALSALDSLINHRNCINRYHTKYGFVLMVEAIELSESNIYEQIDPKQLMSAAIELKRQINDSQVDKVDVDRQLHMNDKQAQKLLRKYMYRPCKTFVRSEDALKTAKLAIDLTKVITANYLKTAQAFETSYATLFVWAARYSLCDQLLKNRDSNSETRDEMKKYQVL